jgi:hypothetical protein
MPGLRQDRRPVRTSRDHPQKLENAGNMPPDIGRRRPNAAALVNNTSVIVERIIDHGTAPWRVAKDAPNAILGKKAVEEGSGQSNGPVRPLGRRRRLVMHLQQLLIHS